MNKIYMSKEEVIEKFGSFFNASLNFELKDQLSTARGFCKFFEEDKHIVIIKQTPNKNSYSSQYCSKNLEDVKNKILDGIFLELKSIISSRKKQLEDYNNSNFLLKSTLKLTALISKSGDKSDPEYVQKAVDYLETKTKEDIEKKIVFVTEYFNEEDSEGECCVVLPEDYEEVLNINHLYLTVLEENYLPQGVYTLNILNREYKFVGEAEKRLVVSFSVEPKGQEMFKVDLDLDSFNNNLEYKFENQRQYHSIFKHEEEALSLFLDHLEKEKVSIERKIIESKERISRVKLIGDLNQPRRIELKD